MQTLEKHAVTLRAVPKQLQTSRTECGVWSIMYIKSRLEGHPPNWFYKNKTTDKDIENFRKYLFRHD
jgi:Ulp1 family protease